MCSMLVSGTIRYHPAVIQTLWVERERGWIVSQQSPLNTQVLNKLTFRVDKLIIPNIISLHAS
jgi:hypothetical protein